MSTDLEQRVAALEDQVEQLTQQLKDLIPRQCEQCYKFVPGGQLESIAGGTAEACRPCAEKCWGSW